jgi:hypothetical protein
MNTDAEKYCEFWVIKNIENTLIYINQYLAELKIEKDRQDKYQTLKDNDTIMLDLDYADISKVNSLLTEINDLKKDNDNNKHKITYRRLLRRIIEKGRSRSELDKFIW